MLALFWTTLLPLPNGSFSLSPSGMRNLNPSAAGHSLKNFTGWTRTKSNRDCALIAPSDRPTLTHSSYTACACPCLSLSKGQTLETMGLLASPSQHIWDWRSWGRALLKFSTAEILVRSQRKLVGIFGGQISTEIVYSPSTSVFTGHWPRPHHPWNRQ